MTNENNSKRYQGDPSGTLIMTVLALVIFVISVWETKTAPTDIYAYLLAGLLIALGYWQDRRTFIEITPDQIISSGYHLIKTDRADINAVREIRRVSATIFGAGGIMSFYSSSGLLLTIREQHYSSDRIKAFLTELATITDVTLDQQYQDLIEGKLDGPNPLSDLRATHAKY